MIPFRDTQFKNVAILLLIVFGAIVSVAMYFTFRNIRDLKSKLASKDQAIEERDAVIKYRTTENGKLIADKQAAELRAEDLEKAYPKLAEAISKQMDIKISRLTAVVQAQFQAQGELLGRIDTGTFKPTGLTLNPELHTFNRHGQLTDKYLNADLYWQDGSNKISGLYTYTDSIVFAFHMKGKWWQRKQLFGSGMLSNPQAKITNMTSIQVKEFKDKRFGIGPSINYDPFINRVTIGVGLHYSLIKF